MCERVFLVGGERERREGCLGGGFWIGCVTFLVFRLRVFGGV